MLLEEIMKLAVMLVENPCCCNLCRPRIELLRRLGAAVREKHGFLEAMWAPNTNAVVVVPDNPGCFVTRVIEGFGTILSCTDIGEKSFKAIVYDRNYNVVGEVKVKRRETKHASYYYTETILKEYEHIAIPVTITPYMKDNNLVGGKGFRYIISQVIGLYMALNYKYCLITVYYSVITPGNELRRTIYESPFTAIIGTSEFYDKVRELIGEKTTFIPVEDDKISLNKFKEIINHLGQKRQV